LQLIDFLKQENLPLSGVTADSRLVKKGALFAALPGTKANGAKFIDDAIVHGATHILVPIGEKREGVNEGVVFLESENVRLDFSKIAAKFYKRQPKNIVAVTGTSGKTSTVSFVQQLWHLAGITKCASLGTLGVRGPNIKRGGQLTTPDSEKLHAELADLASVGIDHLAMEASSHGLDQYRLDGVKINAAAFTNLSRDHMDYHSDMDEYFMAKARLFTDVMPAGSKAIINADDDYAQKLVDLSVSADQVVITFGYKGADLRLKNIFQSPKGQDIEFEAYGQNYNVTLPLAGDFQVMNALCALALSSDEDTIQDFVPLLEKLRGVPGRLQLISGTKKGAVYVDYAHKPGALESVLNTLKPHTKNKLVCVFGCGGNRDQGKRVIMGKIAGDICDRVIVTDDNPRYEEAASIRKQILEAVPTADEIPDRSDAIKNAVENLDEGDVLVIAGKGHEEGQYVQGEIFPFNDAEEVKKAIEGLKL